MEKQIKEMQEEGEEKKMEVLSLWVLDKVESCRHGILMGGECNRLSRYKVVYQNSSKCEESSAILKQIFLPLKVT